MGTAIPLRHQMFYRGLLQILIASSNTLLSFLQPAIQLGPVKECHLGRVERQTILTCHYYLIAVSLHNNSSGCVDT